MLSAELDGAKLQNLPAFATRPTPCRSLFPERGRVSPPLHWLTVGRVSRPLDTSKAGDVEQALAEFFQTVTERSGAIFSEAGKRLPAKPRRWTAEFATAPVPGAPNVRFPDLLCVDGKSCGWADILIHGKLKSSPALKSESITQLVNGAYLAFSAQDDRRFFISLSIIAHKVHLVIFDRSGMTIFLRVLTVLTFCEDRARLGYDTSIITEADGRRFIEVAGRSYELGKTLFVSDVIRGRGTVCWHARCDGQDYVIKDVWADTSRPHTEVEILRKAEEAYVSGVPTVVADAIVQINSIDDSTENIRFTITKATKGLFQAYSKLEKRLHRRIVLTPYCLPLTSFSSRKELVSLLIDAVTAHRDLVNAKILHRDISLNNIMAIPSNRDGTISPVAAGSGLSSPPLTPTTSTSLAPRRGILIDMDYALILDSVAGRTPSVGHRTPKHDLESFLYVLIWICWHYAGPGNVERQNFDIHENSKLRKWVKGDYEDIGRIKESHLLRDWERIILANFAPYFEPLKPCITAWRQLYIDKNLTHESALTVLTNALPALEMEIWSRHDDPAGYGVVKRKLLQIEEEGDEKGDDEEEELGPTEDSTPHPDQTRGQNYNSAPPTIRGKRVIDLMQPKSKRQKSLETPEE
ncbi:hypothetical protein DFH09DRAFT_1274943 [Mycena vulgaris]|nr:hypothetical protein DFH09DRAFT_1274943 [Mycena vulgaris]